MSRLVTVCFMQRDGKVGSHRSKNILQSGILSIIILDGSAVQRTRRAYHTDLHPERTPFFRDQDWLMWKISTVINFRLTTSIRTILFFRTVNIYAEKFCFLYIMLVPLLISQQQTHIYKSKSSRPEKVCTAPKAIWNFHSFPFELWRLLDHCVKYIHRVETVEGFLHYTRF
jgi:hypothetical protein